MQNKSAKKCSTHFFLNAKICRNMQNYAEKIQPLCKNMEKHAKKMQKYTETCRKKMQK